MTKTCQGARCSQILPWLYRHPPSQFPYRHNNLHWDNPHFTGFVCTSTRFAFSLPFQLCSRAVDFRQRIADQRPTLDVERDAVLRPPMCYYVDSTARRQLLISVQHTRVALSQAQVLLSVANWGLMVEADIGHIHRGISTSRHSELRCGS